MKKWKWMFLREHLEEFCTEEMMRVMYPDGKMVNQ
jgi:hypothetical protein